jgi:multimeric flavodoxin WrbA
MKVVGISGSPRRSGNSEILLNRALEGARLAGARVRKVILNELSFKPCQECGGCARTGVCVIKDGMEDIYKLLESADAVIISTPIFFASVSAQTKMMIDRFQCSWEAKYNLKKIGRSKARKGILISVAGSHRKDYFENARGIIKAFFATLDIEYSDELFLGGIDKKAEIDRDEKALDRAFALGQEIASE